METQSDTEEDWIVPSCIESDEENKKYRPKLIRQYEENGVMVRVYEARYV